MKKNRDKVQNEGTAFIRYYIKHIYVALIIMLCVAICFGFCWNAIKSKGYTMDERIILYTSDDFRDDVYHALEAYCGYRHYYNDELESVYAGKKIEADLAEVLENEKSELGHSILTLTDGQRMLYYALLPKLNALYESDNEEFSTLISDEKYHDAILFFVSGVEKEIITRKSVNDFRFVPINCFKGSVFGLFLSIIVLGIGYSMRLKSVTEK